MRAEANTLDSGRDVFVDGVEEEGEFTIAATAKAFRLLIDGIYSDKPRAIIRELWSNAFDAHAMRGTPERPFECHLPTQWEPYFSVRDFGVSMTHEFVMRNYTRVFESTKDGAVPKGATQAQKAKILDAADKQVGKFGLGSKTPFAYTDSFNVIVRFEGRKRIYNCFINEEGKPKIVLFSNEVTDEEQGLEVSFSVKVEDVEHFKRAARMTLPGFDVFPVLSGSKVEGEPLESSIEGTNWKLVKPNQLVQRAAVKQGCVIYPIDTHALDGSFSQHQRELLGAPLFIEGEIGDFSITPSREHLEYTDLTKKSIARYLKLVEAEILAKIEQSISTAKTRWTARKRLNEVLNTYNLPTSFREYARKNAVWRSKKLDTRTRIKSRLGCSLAFVSSYDVRNKRSKIKFEHRNHIDLEVGQKTVFLIQDMNTPVKHIAARIAAYFEQFSYSERADLVWIQTTEQFGKRSFAKLLVELGRPPASEFVKLEDLPIPQSVLDRKAAPKIKVKVLEGYKFEEADVQPEDGGVYVHLSKNCPMNAGQEVSISYINSLIEALKKFKKLDADFELLGIPATYKNIPNKHEGWESFWDIVAAATDLTVDLDFVAAFKNYEENVTDELGWKFAVNLIESGLDKSVILGDDSPLKKLLNEVRFYRELAEDEDTKDILERFRVLEVLRGSIELPAAHPGPVEEAKAVVEAYPLLQVIVGNSWRYHADEETMQKLLDYILLVDNAKKA